MFHGGFIHRKLHIDIEEVACMEQQAEETAKHGTSEVVGHPAQLHYWWWLQQRPGIWNGVKVSSKGELKRKTIFWL